MNLIEINNRAGKVKLDGTIHEGTMEALIDRMATLYGDDAVRNQLSIGETVAVAPTLFQAGRRNKAGERPGTPIDGMIAWARTARGAPILEPEDTGCMRAGLCERGE